MEPGEDRLEKVCLVERRSGQIRSDEVRFIEVGSI
jgi:hypothetical protein